MRIGALAKETGVSIRSLRYWEQMGLLEATRQTNGYRDFAEHTNIRVKKIRTLLDNGFTVEDIRPLIPCLGENEGSERICEKGIELYQRRLSEIDARMQELEEVRQRVVNRIAFMQEHLNEEPSNR